MVVCRALGFVPFNALLLCLMHHVITPNCGLPFPTCIYGLASVENTFREQVGRLLQHIDQGRVVPVLRLGVMAKLSS